MRIKIELEDSYTTPSLSLVPLAIFVSSLHNGFTLRNALTLLPVLALLATVACGSDADNATTPNADADQDVEQDAGQDADDGGQDSGEAEDAGQDADDGGQDDGQAEDARQDAGQDAGHDAGPDPCGEVNAFIPQYPDIIATWSAQDLLGGWPNAPVVFAGSSSIRRWETLAHSYTDFSPLQRGFGGAQLGELAFFADELVTRHNPRAVVVYAGANDIHAGVAPGVVFNRLRCLRYRIGQNLGWDRPVLFVALTPNPSRWAEWPAESVVNAQAAVLAQTDPGFAYVDVASPFLATGSPPDASLFGSDGLHLNESGYALWNSVIRPAVEAATPPSAPAGAPLPDLPTGTRILFDFGPSNPDDGEPTPSPDYLGQTWNNWHAIDGGLDILPGEQRIDLTTSDGSPTGIDLVIAGGFQSNGRSNGGLLWPDSALLGEFAVGSATGDYFYTTGEDVPGALFFRGLDPSRTYTLRLFAARDDAEVRITRYAVQGAASASATLQTSGPGAGHLGGTTNDDDLAEFAGVRPDAWGQLFLDVSIDQGTYGYLSALELRVESSLAP